MPKSRLSTAEIISRREAGDSIAEIAREANISRIAIYKRLGPEPHRNRELIRYGRLSDDKRRAFLATQSKRKQRGQNESAKRARNKSVPWSDEDFEYLRKKGGSRTAFELAVKLGRTVYAVQKMAQRRNISLRN